MDVTLRDILESHHEMRTRLHARQEEELQNMAAVHAHERANMAARFENRIMSILAANFSGEFMRASQKGHQGFVG